MPASPRGDTGRLRSSTQISGVRSGPVGDALPVRHELLEERRRRIAAETLMEFPDPREHMVQADLVSVEHGSAAVHRETIAVQVDDIDIARPLRNTLVENFEPSLTSANTQRSTISSASMARRSMPSSALVFSISAATSGSGDALRVSGS